MRLVSWLQLRSMVLTMRLRILVRISLEMNLWLTSRNLSFFKLESNSSSVGNDGELGKGGEATNDGVEPIGERYDLVKVAVNAHEVAWICGELAFI